MNRSESKYFNTAVRMDEALISLLEKKQFEYISVKEVCAAAGVSRSTFYLHYQNTCDLLEESVKLMHERFLAYFEVEPESFISRLKTCSPQELLLITPEYLTPYLTYVRDHKRIYMAAVNNPTNFRAGESYQKMFVHIFDPILDRFGVAQEEKPFVMAYYLGGISAVVSEWIKGGCRLPIETVVKLIIRSIPRDKAK